MTDYKNLHWSSLDFARTHLLDPLAKACQPGSAGGRPAAHALDRARCRLDAWSALIAVKAGGTLDASERRAVALDALPAWLEEALPVPVVVEGEPAAALVFPAIFFEALIGLGTVAKSLAPTAGQPARVVIARGNNGGADLWARLIFAPPPSGPYKGLREMIARLAHGSPAEQEQAIQLAIVRDLLVASGARLRIQNRASSAVQALAVCFPIAEASAPVNPSTAHVEASASHAAAEESPDQSTPEQAGNDTPHDDPENAPAEEKPRLAGPAVAPAPQSPTKRPQREDSPDASEDTEQASAEAETVETVSLPPITAAQAGDDLPDNGEETLIVPPFSLRERLAAFHASHAESDSADSQLSAARSDAVPDSSSVPDDATPPDESGAETLIVPPAVPRDSLAAPDEVASPAQDAQPSPEIQPGELVTEDDEDADTQPILVIDPKDSPPAPTE